MCKNCNFSIENNLNSNISTVSEFSALWDQWWNDKSHNPYELIGFLQFNDTALATIASLRPKNLPIPLVPYQHSYNWAVNSLLNPKSLLDPVATSEALTDIFKWINYNQI